MVYLIQPTPAKDLKPGDCFRDNSQTFRVSDVKPGEKVVEIVYAFEGERLVNSTFLLLDDTLDKVVDDRTLILSEDGIEALADELLNINHAIIRIAADNGVDPFQNQ